jgi:hypothetical protein
VDLPRYPSWRRPALGRGMALVSVGLVPVNVAVSFAVLRDPMGPEVVPFVLMMSTFAVVGGLIASRRPENPIGWLCVSLGLVLAILGSLDTLSQWAAEHELEVARWIGVLGAAWVIVVGVMGTHLPLRLPDGELPSPGWVAYSRLCTAVIALAFLVVLVNPGSLDYDGIGNPLAVEWADSLVPLVALLPLAVGGAIASVGIRYRRSHGAERLQLRWVALGGAVTAAGFLFTFALGLLGADTEALAPLYLAAFSAIPVAIGIAVLRHRLFDVDVVINRALVYGALSATLAALYAISVLVLQLALGDLTAGSDLAVAGSTLAVAAAFRPARSRIQHEVDRRFFRRRYDARRTLEVFSGRIRDQVDLGAVDAELRAMVIETMQPSHVSLWLRERGG